jgi:hypothetical protein
LFPYKRRTVRYRNAMSTILKRSLVFTQRQNKRVKNNFFFFSKRFRNARIVKTTSLFGSGMLQATPFYIPFRDQKLRQKCLHCPQRVGAKGS